MDKKDLIARLQELYLYDLFGFNTALKPLSMVLNIDEQVNCFATGVYQGKRRMLAVTNYRIILIFAGVLARTEVTIIKREAVKNYKFEKHLFGSKITIQTSEETIVLTNTQRRIDELFIWAMEQPLVSFNEE